MRNIKRLSESDLNRIVKKIVNEQSDETNSEEIYDMYRQDIESGVENLRRTVFELESIYNEIYKNENLDDRQREELLSEIEYYLNNM